MNWTAQDEQAYREADKRFLDLHARRCEAVKALKHLLDAIPIDDGYWTSESLDHVIRNADSLRDALLPFDSGVRQG